jgi:hypothetical protein
MWKLMWRISQIILTDRDPMKKHIAVLAVFTLSLVGCDNYKSSFAKAISQNLEATGSLCLGIKKWPIEVTAFDIKMKSRKALTFSYLEVEGLVRIPTALYTPSERAKPFMIGPDICWGKKVLAEVVEWDGPMSNGGYKEAVVQYTYQVVPMNWVVNSGITYHYPEMNLIQQGPQKAEATLKLTSAGWEAK